MKKIVFSLHSLNKIQILSKHQIFVDKNLITKIITKPNRIESGYKNRLVAQGVLDDKHVIRIIYCHRHSCGRRKPRRNKDNYNLSRQEIKI